MAPFRVCYWRNWKGSVFRDMQFQYFPFDVTIAVWPNVSKLTPHFFSASLSHSSLSVSSFFLSFCQFLVLSRAQTRTDHHIAPQGNWNIHRLEATWNHDLENGLSYVPSYIKVFRMQSHFARLLRHKVVSVVTLPVFVDACEQQLSTHDAYRDLPK